MNQQLRINHTHLRIAHQSELVQLRKMLNALQAELQALKQSMVKTEVEPIQRKIALNSSGQHYYVSLNDILYCQAEGNYTKVFLRREHSVQAEQNRCSILISKTLKSTIDLINSDQFIRCHQSYFVNISHVIGYKNDKRHYLIMKNNERIPVSRRKVPMIREFLK